jgi:hypothetical protein
MILILNPFICHPPYSMPTNGFHYITICVSGYRKFGDEGEDSEAETRLRLTYIGFQNEYQIEYFRCSPKRRCALLMVVEGIAAEEMRG